jgi:hypothetical protein
MKHGAAVRAEEHAAGDEYDLKPGEMTKEMVADKAQVTLRAVEMWKKEGKLPARKERRRIKGTETIRKQLIFLEKDVDEFLNGENVPTHVPTIAKSDGNNNQALQTAVDTDKLFNLFGAMFQEMNNQPRLSRLEQLSGKLFLDIDQASEVSGISKAKLTAAIHEAENAEDPQSRLQRFSGDHGRAVWRTRDIEMLIETIPPTPILKRLPPRKGRKE